jgi:Ca-activated chloride channel family protein
VRAQALKKFGLAAPFVVMACVAAAGVTTTAQTFRTGVDVVNVSLAIMDKQGTAIDGLQITDFEVYEGGKKQELRYFARGDAEKGAQPPLHVGLLFDTSGSMGEDIRMARSAAIKFLNRLMHAEDMTIVDFDTEVRTMRYSQDEFPRLVERLRSRKPDGWTALYDALGTYLTASLDQLGQKVLVLYTDGGDTRSAMSFNDLLTSLKAADVTVYAIGFLEHQGSNRNMQRMQLQQIADVTGGQAFFPLSLKEIDKVYDRVIAELEGRYVLGYVSTNPKMDGTWRPVDVKLLRNDLKNVKIRTRKGYFAPYREPASK